jgi:hypothetical protein
MVVGVIVVIGAYVVVVAAVFVAAAAVEVPRVEVVREDAPPAARAAAVVEGVPARATGDQRLRGCASAYYYSFVCPFR